MKIRIAERFGDLIGSRSRVCTEGANGTDTLSTVARARVMEHLQIGGERASAIHGHARRNVAGSLRDDWSQALCSIDRRRRRRIGDSLENHVVDAQVIACRSRILSHADEAENMPS